jgi:hypothetical protein
MYHIKPIQDIECQDKLGWEIVLYRDRIVGFRNPRVGSFMRYAVLDGDEFKYDFVVHEDGPLDKDGIATPGVVVVPVREVNGLLMVRSVIEWRPVIRDPNTGKLGVKIQGLPGGFAKKTRQLGTESAFYQAMTELGIEILELELIGRASPNRAYTSTCIRYYVATYQLAGDAQPEKLESILGSSELPLYEFPLGLDGIVNTAIAFTWRYFNMIHK